MGNHWSICSEMRVDLWLVCFEMSEWSCDFFEILCGVEEVICGRCDN